MEFSGILYLSESLGLQGFVVSQAAVTSGPCHRPERMSLRIGLPVRVDASCAAEGAQAPLLWALHPGLADGHLVRAAGTSCGPRGCVNRSGGAVGFCATLSARDGGSIGPQPHPVEQQANTNEGRA